MKATYPSSANEAGAVEPKSNREPVGFGKPDCATCHGIGYVREDLPITHPRFGKAQICSCCLEDMQKAYAENMLSISNREALSGKLFENFQPEGHSPYTQHRMSLKNAWNKCREFAENPSSSKWLFLHGTYGCGKTHLAAAIANALVERGQAVVFMNVTDLLDHLREAFSAGVGESLMSRLDRIRDAPVLILDDLGAESPTPWAMEKLYQIINFRYNGNLPTVVTSNRDISRLEPRIASRLQDTEHVTVLQISAPDYRMGRKDANPSGLSLPPAYKSKTFASFKNRENLPEDGLRLFNQAIRTAQDFAQKPEGWLTLVGANGTGKTHLAAAIANYREERGQPVIFMPFEELMDTLRGSLGAEDDNESPANPNTRRVVAILRTIELLVIDDVPAGLSVWRRDKLLQILDYRFELRQPTVITTSAYFDQLEKRVAYRVLYGEHCQVLLLPAVPYNFQRSTKLPYWYSPTRDKDRKTTSGARG
jgi:DNA replication protein DnaC